MNSDFEKGKKKPLHKTQPVTYCFDSLLAAFVPLTCANHVRPRRTLGSWTVRWRSLAAEGNGRKDDQWYVSEACSSFSDLLNCYSLPITWLPELLPAEVTCAKETRDLVIECCVGEHRQWSSCASLGLTFGRIYSLDLVGGQRDMWARIQEDNSTGAYHRGTESMFMIDLYPPLTSL